MDLAIKLIVFLPLIAAAIAGLFCRVIGARPAQIVTCAALLIAAALSVFVFVKIGFGAEEADRREALLLDRFGHARHRLGAARRHADAPSC